MLVVLELVDWVPFWEMDWGVFALTMVVVWVELLTSPVTTVEEVAVAGVVSGVSARGGLAVGQGGGGEVGSGEEDGSGDG